VTNPMFAKNFDRIPECALDWIDEGREVSIATVVATWGSAPRPVGSQMVVARTGEIEGSVSGGCVEGAVILEAQAALDDGRKRVLTFGVTSEDAFSAGLACGGEIRVLVEPVGDGIGAGQGMPVAILRRLVAARAARKPIIYEVNFDNWQGTLKEDTADTTVQTGIEDGVFRHVHHTPLRLIIAGAVHVAQALVPMAQMVGYDVILIDPRSAFANEERFPGVTLIADDPEDALKTIALDRRTAVVTLAHDPKIDDPALEMALQSDAFYIGSLGSRRTQGQRLDRLAERGYAPEALRRINGPVGLDIGSVGPAEIAVSIMAELVAVQRRIF